MDNFHVLNKKVFLEDIWLQEETCKKKNYNPSWIDYKHYAVCVPCLEDYKLNCERPNESVYNVD